MQVKVGDIIANCPRCRGTAFVPAGPEKFRCAACDAIATRSELLLQISDRAERRARQTLRGGEA